MKNRSLAATASLALAIVAASHARAAPPLDFVRWETPCPKTDREARSLRQTVVIVDEALITADPASVQRLTRMVVEAADARDSSAAGFTTMGARERLSILVARRDGSELVPIFGGCVPNLTAEELTTLRGQDGLVDRFFGGATDSRMQKSRTDYVTAIARALAPLVKQAAEIGAQPVKAGSIVSALRQAGRLADPELGLPRFLILSPFAITSASGGDVASARRLGFDLARNSGVDFGRAEVYVAGSALAGGTGLETVRSFVLGSRGNLVGIRSDALPRLGPEPVRAMVFAGFFDNVGVRTRMQLRLAVSASGELVNSWVETLVMRSAATPLDGKAICRAGGDCEVLSRERFARAWLPDPQGEPPNRSEFPFGAAANVDLTVTPTTARGAVWDEKLRFRPENGPPVDRLTFELQRVEGGRF